MFALVDLCFQWSVEVNREGDSHETKTSIGE
jgi:hypothetical protein